MSEKIKPIRNTGPRGPAGVEAEKDRKEVMAEISEEFGIGLEDLMTFKEDHQVVSFPEELPDSLSEQERGMLDPEALKKLAGKEYVHYSKFTGTMDGKQVTVVQRGFDNAAQKITMDELSPSVMFWNRSGKEVLRKIFGEAYGDGERYQATIGDGKLDGEAAKKLFDRLNNATYQRNLRNQYAKDNTIEEIDAEAKKIDEVNEKLKELGRDPINPEE
jgi:hypothetical protein